MSLSCLPAWDPSSLLFNRFVRPRARARTHIHTQDGFGGLQTVKHERLRSLCAAGFAGRGAALRFVFVSACHSHLSGMAFADAGVAHVVCVKMEAELLDSAAQVFTRWRTSHTHTPTSARGCKGRGGKGGIASALTHSSSSPYEPGRSTWRLRSGKRCTTRS